jgi:predicted TPR repeat methyltransferase
MTPKGLLSGDLLADRRADYAEMLFGSGEPRAAAEVMMGALEHAPGWAMGWFRLGEFHEAAGSAAEAATAWRMVLRLDPSDRPGATLKLALIGDGPAPSAPPGAFVEALYDQYAAGFDHSLVDTLGYRGPELMMEAILGTGVARFDRAVDLGCGTGLMGLRLRPIVGSLSGYDISAAMLKKAKARGVYDRLEKADLQALVLPAGSVDLMTVADVLIYVGALDRLFAMVADALAPGGVFAFSVELDPAHESFRLRETRRYAHSCRYVEAVLSQSGFADVSVAEAVIRQDRNAPVDGLIITARKPTG